MKMLLGILAPFLALGLMVMAGPVGFFLVLLICIPIFMDRIDNNKGITGLDKRL